MIFVSDDWRNQINKTKHRQMTENWPDGYCDLHDVIFPRQRQHAPRAAQHQRDRDIQEASSDTLGVSYI